MGWRMNLTVKMKNIGIIKQTEFTLGDLTILCGENNTGKTQISYALYGFLCSWPDFIRTSISDEQVNSLIASGSIEIEVKKTIHQILTEACKTYTNYLDRNFAAPEGTFQKSVFHIMLDNFDSRHRVTENTIEDLNGHFFTASFRRKPNADMIITLKMVKGTVEATDRELVKNAIHMMTANILFGMYLPRVFISTFLRAGINSFWREIDFARNKQIERITQTERKVDLRDILSEGAQIYPSSIEDNIGFPRQVTDIAKRKSFITKEHPEVIDDLSEIVGGEYVIANNDQLYFLPKGSRTKLTLIESSSTVRSLLDLNFYLRHIARRGDLLMVDEPELSLHPENQRRIARLFARLVNLGIKIFITTHSDYIIKELNTLIMLNHKKPRLKRIAEENGYQESELIKADQIKLYMGKKALVPLEEGQKRRKRAHTLVPAKIHPKFGIEVPSFDKTIDDMNRIQDEIVWGEE